jgi:hypothetical protein
MRMCIVFTQRFGGRYQWGGAVNYPIIFYLTPPQTAKQRIIKPYDRLVLSIVEELQARRPHVFTWSL